MLVRVSTESHQRLCCVAKYGVHQIKTPQGFHDIAEQMLLVKGSQSFCLRRQL